MIYLHISKRQSDFARVLFSRNFADANVHENKTLKKISKFTAYRLQYEKNGLPIFPPSKSQTSLLRYRD